MATYRAPEKNVPTFWRISQGDHFCILVILKKKKHEFGRGRWDLAFCQVPLDSVQRFQISRKCLSQSDAGAAILVFRFARKNTNLVEDVEILLHLKFCWNPFSGFRGEVENVSANQRPGGHLVFPIGPKNTNRGRWDLASHQVSLNPVQRRSRKCPSNSETGRSSCFSDRPEKHKLGRIRWDLASCQASLNSIQQFTYKMRNRKCVSQSEARWTSFFPDRPKYTNLVEDVEIFGSVVSGEKSKVYQAIRGKGAHLDRWKKSIQENTEKRVPIFLINRAFAVRELTRLLRDIRVYKKIFLCLF